MSTETLNEFQTKQPGSNDKMARSVGYGVFNKTATAVLVGGTANAYGVIHDKMSGKEAYMRAFTGTFGWEFGRKRYQLATSFDDPAVMEKCVSTGWDFGTQASATAKADDKGDEVAGAVTVKRSMDIYEFTEKELFLHAHIKATRFWPARNLSIE